MGFSLIGSPQRAAVNPSIRVACGLWSGLGRKQKSLHLGGFQLFLYVLVTRVMLPKYSRHIKNSKQNLSIRFFIALLIKHIFKNISRWEMHRVFA